MWAGYALNVRKITDEVFSNLFELYDRKIVSLAQVHDVDAIFIGLEIQVVSNRLIENFEITHFVGA